MTTSQNGDGCDCLYPSITYLGKCGSELTYYKVNQLRLHLLDIPLRFFSENKINWEQQEALAAMIDTLCFTTYDKIRYAATAQNRLCYYRNTLYQLVCARFLRDYGLQLTRDDEETFKYTRLV